MDLRQVFAQDAQRLERLSMQAPHVFADLSKNRWNSETEALLLQLAEECQLAGKRDAMLAGDAINTSEQRSVMHWLLRTPRDGGALAASAAVQAWP
ncbi:MAG: glucose-6-phosphate isomerase, partial [Comamonas sp.]